MTDVTVHIASKDWCVHFLVTTTQTPVGPWLLFESNDEIKAKVFTWGHVAEEELAQYEIDLRRWGIGSVHMEMTDNQLYALAERKRGWLWNGYELRLMKEAGKYAPKRLNIRFLFSAEEMIVLAISRAHWLLISISMSVRKADGHLYPCVVAGKASRRELVEWLGRDVRSQGIRPRRSQGGPEKDMCAGAPSPRPVQ